MIVKVYKEDILEGLQKSANIIPARTGAAYLRTIWVKAENGQLSLMSTDSNLEFAGSYQAEIVEEGLAGVQGRSFYDLVKRLPPGEITLKLEGDGRTMIIEQNQRNYKLPTNDVTWFQNLNIFPDVQTVVWSGDYLEELIDRVAYCISDEDTMEAIACMSLKPSPEEGADGKLEACGLNGHQFAMVSFVNQDLAEIIPEEGILIQKKYIMELKKWLASDSVELAISEKRLFFRSGDGRETFSLPLSYYQYPDYRNFLSKLKEDSVSALAVNRASLADSLERLLIFNTESNRCTYFDFSGDGLVLTTQGQEVGSAKETLEADFKGDIKRIAFPTRNLIEMLGHFASDSVGFTLTGSEGPCGIRGEDDPDYLTIIMPMKIVEETYYSEEDI
ncbi:DNA polymerase III subunit beta [Oceanidesulfovibrio indonesiensis]|jgi:DNA polymerase-3 subunit beta|uniref:Beta sliding clamp n=1 Tax=Oceanidesulfovibrio indonesiensis TaxID=54767 RepID=A0A7M3MDG5_9BACT|nr:DNA polymerase III subunit beta [Oceanidesulfovibrio indonesiensis]TVM16616.1 DNA polymerase III subunit beta [Oceanidesulfovibrio indonesiensis]